MGSFLAAPLMAELEACATESMQLAEVRRILEVLVPLMYRPAMKVSRRPKPWLQVPDEGFSNIDLSKNI